MAAAAMGAMVVGSLFAAYQTYQSGQQQKVAYNSQALEQERQAGNVEAAGASNVRELEYQRNLVLGQEGGAAAGGGVTESGSVLEVMQETNRRSAINISNTEFNTASQAYALRRGAAISRYTGSQAARAGVTGAITTALTGGGQAYFASQTTKGLTPPTYDLRGSGGF